MVLGMGGTVLVVEDDDSMREAIERLLNAAGFGCAGVGFLRWVARRMDQ
jgi:FixJ family two-component response regulator